MDIFSVWCKIPKCNDLFPTSPISDASLLSLSPRWNLFNSHSRKREACMILLPSTFAAFLFFTCFVYNTYDRSWYAFKSDIKIPITILQHKYKVSLLPSCQVLSNLFLTPSFRIWHSFLLRCEHVLFLPPYAFFYMLVACCTLGSSLYDIRVVIENY